MTAADRFPIFFPDEARRAFGSEETCRRIANVAHLSGGARVLELHASNAGILLAKEFGCAVVAAEDDEKKLESLRERVKAHTLVGRVEVRKIDPGSLPFADG